MTNLTDFLQSKNFNIQPVLDGTIIRFNREGGSKNAWFVGHEIHMPKGKTLVVATFGDWRTNEKYEFKTNGNCNWDTDEQLQAQRKLQDLKNKEKQERRKNQQMISSTSENIWNKIPARETPIATYLIKKLGTNCQSNFQCKTQPALNSENEHELLVPCRDIDGKLWGVQKITPTGQKLFTPGQRVSGTFHKINQAQNCSMPNVILLCEGIATAASLHMATGCETYACFNAKNLPTVAALLPKHTQIIICADNDAYTIVDGKPRNVGLECAHQAQLLCGTRATVIYPSFSAQDPAKPTDWNDYHAKHGLQALQAEILRQSQPPQANTTVQPTPQPLTMETTQPQPTQPIQHTQTTQTTPARRQTTNTTRTKIPERTIVEAILQERPTLVSTGRELFEYHKTHWTELSTVQENDIKARISELYGATESSKTVESTFKHLAYFLPKVPPENFFQPNPLLANFQNGTLELLPKELDFELNFRPHKASDYLTRCLPFDFVRPNEENLNPQKSKAFLQTLENLFGTHEDKIEKIQLVQEMFAACLIPTFPHLFLLHGPPKTGKTTLILLLSHLLDDKNISRVEPADFHGFLMENLPGKLANIVTDIDENKPIADANIKKIEDRVPVAINRKGKTVIYAPLPSVHIFGANNIPPTLNGLSNAHDRRWTFIQFGGYTPPNNYNRNYAHYVWDTDKDYIIAWTIAGLYRLTQNRGHFSKLLSSEKSVENWKMQSDAVKQFIDACEAGEVFDQGSCLKIKPSPLGALKRAIVFDAYADWMKKAQAKPIDRAIFYRKLQELGLRLKTVNGERQIEGLELQTGNGDPKF